VQYSNHLTECTQQLLVTARELETAMVTLPYTAFPIYTVSQKKTRHQTLGHNFNYYPIFKIFSLADSVVNLHKFVFKYSTTLNMSLHYLVKYECQKNGIILKYILKLMMNHKVV